MNPDLEALILAFDAFLETKAEAEERAYNLLLDQVAEKHPGRTSECIHNAVRLAHARWVRKRDSKPPHIPPTA